MTSSDGASWYGLFSSGKCPSVDNNDNGAWAMVEHEGGDESVSRRKFLLQMWEQSLSQVHLPYPRPSPHGDSKEYCNATGCDYGLVVISGGVARATILFAKQEPVLGPGLTPGGRSASDEPLAESVTRRVPHAARLYVRPVFLCIGLGLWLTRGTEDLFRRNAMWLSAVGILVTGTVLHLQQLGMMNVLGLPGSGMSGFGPMLPQMPDRVRDKSACV
ncbi:MULTISPECIES: hypothetical protein [unclassified Pseudomonas]|uniref:hypothetical protein n=1 Tax=unclassified Pseudomonas TaxID=196821 RepID=UPI0011AF8D27|nr:MULTISPECIES: hypothetical protein [unclassified Pseudomonas]